jgi:hypothetical protein
LPHCAASPDPPVHAATATAANMAATNCLPLIIEKLLFRRRPGRNTRKSIIGHAFARPASRFVAI